MKILNKFILSIILLLVVSSTVFGQLGRFGSGGSLAVTETATNYTITKDTVTIAGHLSVTTITFTTIVGTGTIDLTITNTTAGGDIGLNLQISQTTNALTGDLIGVRGNSRVNIDSPSGSAYGGKFQAGNMTAGFDLFAARGVYSEVVNKIPSGAKTWTHARAYEGNMDLNQGSAGNVTTITNAAINYGVYNLPTVGTYTTVTNGYGAFYRNEQVGGDGQMLDAILYGDDLNMGGGVKGWDFGVDFSGIEANFGTADFRLSDGALINNTDADNLVITEANVDITGASTASSYTSDADITVGGHIDQNGASGILNNEIADTTVFAQSVGIGIEPAGGMLHIFEGSSGIGSYPGSAELVVESDGALTVDLLVPDGNVTGFQFGVGALNVGSVAYDDRGSANPTDQLILKTLLSGSTIKTDPYTEGAGITIFGETGDDDTTRVEGHFDVTGDAFTGRNGNEENYLNVEIFNDSTVTGETTWSSVLPAGFIIESIIFKNTTANEVTDLDIGFSDAGGEVVAAANLLASDEGSFTLLQRVDDFDAADTLFISADNWNSASIVIYIRMVRIF